LILVINCWSVKVEEFLYSFNQYLSSVIVGGLPDFDINVDLIFEATLFQLSPLVVDDVVYVILTAPFPPFPPGFLLEPPPPPPPYAPPFPPVLFPSTLATPFEPTLPVNEAPFPPDPPHTVQESNGAACLLHR